MCGGGVVGRWRGWSCGEVEVSVEVELWGGGGECGGGVVGEVEVSVGEVKSDLGIRYGC